MGVSTGTLSIVQTASPPSAPASGYDRLTFTAGDQIRVTNAAGKSGLAYFQGPNPWIDVTSFGAKGDGITDDTTAIQNTINQAAATTFGGQNGAKVYFPSGNYLVTATLTLPPASVNVAFVGADDGSSTIKASFTTGDVIQLLSGGSGFAVMNLGLTTGSTVHTSGAYINTNGANDVVIQNVSTTGALIGLLVSGGSTDVLVDNCEFINPVASTGFGVQVNNNAARTTIRGCHFRTNVASASMLEITQTTGLRVADCWINGASSPIGVDINPSASTVSHVSFVGCTIQGASTNVKFNFAAANAIIESIAFVECVITGSSSGAGVLTTGGGVGAVCDDLSFTGCRITQNNGNGFTIGVSTVNLRIVGCLITGNGQGGSNSFDGVSIAANVNSFSIVGCKIGTGGVGQTSIQRWGINIAAGTSNNFVIEGNDLTGNLTGAINNAGPTMPPAGLNMGIVANNVGHMQAGCIAVTTAASGPITTFETVIVGGVNSGAVFPANSLRVGTTIRVTWEGQATSTAANTSQFILRFGANGTTADTSIGSLAISAATSGTAQQFKLVCEIVITAVGASGAGRATWMLLNGGGTTGIIAQAVFLTSSALSNINTTVSSYLSATYVVTANSTSVTFQAPSLIEVLRT